MSHINAASTAFTSLPFIDISPFLPENHTVPGNDEKKKAVAKQLDTACREVGFFYLTGHGVPEEATRKVLDVAREFFQQPREEKEKLSIRNQPGSGRGYQRLGENVTRYQKDWHEAVDLYRELPADHNVIRWLSEGSEEEQQRKSGMRPLVTDRNQWPNTPAEFKPLMEEYVQTCQRVGGYVMRAMALGLGLEEGFFEDTYLNEGFWVMRVIGYPPLASSEGHDGVGRSCGEHTDYGCLTLVNQDQTPGALQVMNAAGEWVNANPIPGAFVVNIGDMITIWTNGLYKSTLHRVMNIATNYRVSIPFFYEPNYDSVITPLPNVGDPASYSQKAVMYGDHLFGKVANNFDTADM
eukprot:GILJ01003414.1.p1 GENE.GILJ01003414.1~~GILJ01003414.1.p1  ORF type:complete len:352 (-),score=45.12 GILJ01003414.1:95-1150(-)